MSAKHDDIARALHDMLLAFQRKRRLIVISLGAGADAAAHELGYVEESVLQTLRDGSGRSIGELSEIVQVERSWMSRVVTALSKRALVLIKPNPEDARAKVVRITEEGRETIASAATFTKNVIDQALLDLSKSERLAMGDYLAELNEASGAPRGPHFPDSDTVDRELTSLSQVTGVVAGNILGSGFNVAQLQVLSVLASKEAEMLVRDLDELLPFDASTISRVVSAFEEEGILTKSQDDRDKRSFRLKLSRRGRERYAGYERLALKFFSSAIQKMSRPSVDGLIELLDKATFSMPKAPTRTEEGLRIVPVRSLERRAGAVKHDETSSNFFRVDRHVDGVASIKIVRERHTGNILELSIFPASGDSSEVAEILKALDRQFL